MITYAATEKQGRRKLARRKLVTIGFSEQWKAFLKERSAAENCSYREYLTLLLQAERFRLEAKQAVGQ